MDLQSIGDTCSGNISSPSWQLTAKCVQNSGIMKGSELRKNNMDKRFEEIARPASPPSTAPEVSLMSGNNLRALIVLYPQSRGWDSKMSGTTLWSSNLRIVMCACWQSFEGPGVQKALRGSCVNLTLALREMKV